MKKLLTGDEAIARGAYEAGVRFASAYPGTPSTEILENIAGYDEIHAEWAVNEKVALETAIGASMAGVRSMASMKHVGLNVAADPFFTWAYTGVNGGNVIITADEPGQFSSQNEQDNRNYAKFAKIPMVEPTDSQECKDMMGVALDVSEQFDTPVLLRMTTRVCHSKSLVECKDRKEVPVKEYVVNLKKFVTIPAHARVLRVKMEDRMKALEEYSEKTPLNFAQYNDLEVGVIASGVCYTYAKEVFGDKASYLKLGFTSPLPSKLISEFCTKVKLVYVIEENDPYIEEKVKLLGFDCKGKDTFPPYGEMTPDVIRKAVYNKANDEIEYSHDKVIARPPALCAGCPHRGFFYELGKRKNLLISGDIGCYTLAVAKPYNAIHSAICMGASFSVGHGAQQVFQMTNSDKRVVAVLGDSTFFHTGINSLINTVYNQSNTVSVILDNRITGMTGHQQNPGTGYNAKEQAAPLVDIEKVVRAIGVEHVFVIDPNDLKLVKDTLDKCLNLDAPSVIITRYPCVLKKFSQEDKEEFKDAFKEKCVVDHDKCIGCKICLKTGCPALSFDKETKKSNIDKSSCVGCEVCKQVCPKQAIVKEVK